MPFTNKKLELFTWGYFGWGNAPHRLVQAIDAVERSRGFEPPLFVDIRISRSVRAAGFRDNAFAETVGGDRYRWMQSLGNTSILTGRGRIRIKNPQAAEELLDLAEESHRRDRRLLVFCSCQLPGSERHQDNCHRVTVAGLVLEAARQRGVTAAITEWPGGSAEVVRRQSSEKRGRVGWIRLGERLPAAKFLALPWGSACIVGERVHITGPARYRSDGWHLPTPLPNWDADRDADLKLAQLNAAWWRYRYGLEPRQEPAAT